MNETNQSTASPPRQTVSRYKVQTVPAILTRGLIFTNLAIYIITVGIGIAYLSSGGSSLGQFGLVEDSLFNRIAAYAQGVMAIIVGSYYPPNATPDLLTWGMKVNYLILNGETWRLLTATFLHLGPLHILFNMVILNFLGPMVEGYFGHVRFAFIYVMAGLFGSLASYAFSYNPSAGASGAIFGVAGAVTVFFIRYRNNFGNWGQTILQSVIGLIIFNVVLGPTQQGIDNWGHFGGLVGGIAASWILLPRYALSAPATQGEVASPSSQSQLIQPENRITQELLGATLLLILFWVGLQFANSITPIF
ncbi:MAG: rhomboid family intramembrane serine protease [Chloroflexota bacterium]